jgi:hypothetical protein
MEKMRLSRFGMGMALGLVWGLMVLVMGLLAHYLQYGVEFVTSLGTVYIGYEKTIVGSFIGAGFAFLDGFVGGILIALFYNLFARCKSCCRPKE